MKGLGDDRNYQETCEQALGELGDEIAKEEAKKVLAGTDTICLPNELTADGPDLDALPLHALIRDMSIPQKIKLAIFGNKTARNILIRDTNKQIPLFVLQNNRLSDGELVEIAKNKDLQDGVYRAISNNSVWMKTYAIRLAIVSNPKVPSSISMKWLRYLMEKDLRRLAKSKDIPQVVANQCQRLLDKGLAG